MRDAHAPAHGRWLRPVARLSLSLSLSAGVSCAMGARSAETPGQVVVEVRNNLTPPTSITVFVLPESGGREYLGSVDPLDTRELTVPQPPTGTYRFLARTAEGSEFVTNPVAFRPGEVLQWDVFSGVVTPKVGRSMARASHGWWAVPDVAM